MRKDSAYTDPHAGSLPMKKPVNRSVSRLLQDSILQDMTFMYLHSECLTRQLQSKESAEEALTVDLEKSHWHIKEHFLWMKQLNSEAL